EAVLHEVELAVRHFAVPRDVGLSRRRRGESEHRSPGGGLGLDPLVRFPTLRVAGVPVLRHRIPEVRNPGLSRSTCDRRADLVRSGDRICAPQRIDPMMTNQSKSSSYGPEAPARPSVGQCDEARISSSDGQVLSCIEARCTNHLAILWNLGQAGVVDPLVGGRINREHDRFPAVFRQILREAQGPLHTAAPGNGWEVVRDEKDFAHGRRKSSADVRLGFPGLAERIQGRYERWSRAFVALLCAVAVSDAWTGSTEAVASAAGTVEPYDPAAISSTFVHRSGPKVWP